jgi:esterase/lipase
MLIPTAKPFFFPDGNPGCLLVPGFTVTLLNKMRWTGDYLGNKGYTVLGVRLAGHAIRPEDMPRIAWQDCLASVEHGYHQLKCCWVARINNRCGLKTMGMSSQKNRTGIWLSKLLMGLSKGCYLTPLRYEQ